MRHQKKMGGERWSKPAVLLLLLALLGSLAGPAHAQPANQPVIFGAGLLPGAGSSVPVGSVLIGCTVNSALALSGFGLTIDNQLLQTTISGTGPWQLRASATLSVGVHTAGATATDAASQSGGWTWQFTVAGGPPPPTQPPPGPQPKPTTLPPPPGGAGPSLRILVPADGWLEPASTQRIAVLFGTDTGWAKQTVSLDGRDLGAKPEPGSGAAGHIALSASAPAATGAHIVTALGVDKLGRQGTGAWTFLASDPADDGDLRVSPVAPAPGTTLNDGSLVRLAAQFNDGKANLQAGSIMLDGRALLNEGTGTDPHQGRILVDASRVPAGRHTVRAEASDIAGRTTAVAWDFYIGAPASPDERLYYAQTGFSLTGPFRNYWEGLGANALPVLGYPISGLLVERLDNGHTYTVQYFERVRLEWHPENHDTQFEVLYGLLGTNFHEPDPPIPAPPARPGERYFAETGHLARGPFLQKWQTTGGLATYGFPISEELNEVSKTDGRAYLVQYFQRARMEYHPENADTPFEILLGMLGRQLYDER
ncbi:MAG: hypothetical protein ACR2M0_00930 [Chloroflexia bacterium]